MKYGFLGAILIAVFAVTAAQAEDGRMSRSKLSDLGLSSLQSATDAEGMQVRGQGRMFMSGAHIAFAGPSSSSFSYGAQAKTKNAFGFGGAQTLAEYTVITNGVSISFNAAAIGRSFAFSP